MQNNNKTVSHTFSNLCLKNKEKKVSVSLSYCISLILDVREKSELSFLWKRGYQMNIWLISQVSCRNWQENIHIARHKSLMTQ